MNQRLDSPSMSVKSSLPRRSLWRQRLVQAERGFVGNLRSDSTLYAHFFAWMVVLLIGLIVRLTWHYWIFVALSLMFALSGELFHQAFRTLLTSDDRPLNEAQQRALGLATAGAIASALAAIIALSVIFYQQFQHLL